MYHLYYELEDTLPVPPAPAPADLTYEPDIADLYDYSLTAGELRLALLTPEAQALLARLGLPAPVPA